MSRRWLLFPFCLSVLVVLAPLSRASLTLRVDESAARVWFEEEGTRVSLAVENSLGRAVDTHIKVELIDTSGQARALADHDEQLKPGANTVVVPVAIRLAGQSVTDTRDLLWYRLRYRIQPTGSSQLEAVSGLISLSRITPDVFALHVAAPEKGHEGGAYRLRVQTVHPLTSTAIAGVNINAEIIFDGPGSKDIVLRQTGRSGPDGFATLDFQIPRGIEGDDGTIKVEARRGLLVETAKSQVELDHRAQILVSTDKPLYQPGQTVHARILAFDPSRHALGNEKATLKISDPDNTTVFRSDLTTSRFGVASTDWALPDNQRLGGYLIEVSLDRGTYEDSSGAASVKISRYDLPNFSVNVKPDRAYYVPGQDAEVEVRADYLFGQPVKHGHVRVVRETERRWSYSEQKWETEEGDSYDGDVGGDGHFVAHVKLGDAHKELKDQDYSRYRDLSYAAYFTDTTTNRTEERRFDLRLTKDPIHVYIIERGYQHYRHSRDFPLEFYVSTSYADGSPASCEVTISHVWESDDSPNEQALQTIKTNRYGLAKVDSLTVPRDEDDHERELSLAFHAHDSRALTGNHTETFSLYDEPVVRIGTDKVLYRPGDPIHAEIFSNQREITLAVDAITQQNVIQSQLVTLQNGRASVTFPYRQSSDGAVTIAAYSLAKKGEDDTTFGSHTVLYPHDRDLKFKLALDRESYRPGDAASASFLARTAAGRPAESALGVVIFDKAVEERARTDREFGGNYGFYGAYCSLGGCDGLAGVTRKDLDRIDLSQPLPAGLELVAEILLNDSESAPKFFNSDIYENSPAAVFASPIKEQIAPLNEHLQSEYNTNCVYPADQSSLRRFASSAGIDLDDLRDPWEIPYRASFSVEGSFDVLQLQSAGPDKQFGTADDFTVMRVERPYFRSIGEAINRTVADYHWRRGQFIRDAVTLKSELQREGIDFDALRDPWGQPYRFEFGVNQTRYSVIVRSSGPDRQFSPKANGDDVTVWTSWIDYSRDLQQKVDAALVTYFKQANQIPRNDVEFSTALKQSGINPEELVDPWGRPYYATFSQKPTYGNRITILSYAKYGEKPIDKTELTPVTQQISYIYLRSVGEDGKRGTADDFNVGSFSRIVTEESAEELNRAPVNQQLPVLSGSTGAITGTVTDPNGAIIPGAVATAKNKRTSAEFSATSNDSGVYIIRNVPAGTYEVNFQSPGFQRTVFTEVPVRSSSVTHIDVSLSVAAATETVTISAAAGESTLNMTSSSVVENRVSGIAGTVQSQLATPRLRDYFPETLVWQPSLETDKQGRAQLKFKFADNITTWKMSVIASTEDGQIGTVDKEIKAFQPFFVEHDPPRVLTEGDEISLPVVVRNYLDHAQTVNLGIKPERWFTMLGPAAKSIEVAAGDATRGVFDFRAGTTVKDGKQRITAVGSDANDAIEKPVTVHPDGEEQSVTASDIVSDNGSLTFAIPDSLVPNSARAELKIYPNLMAHVVESVEAIMERPYGCGEQTISSTYPSLLVLRNYKDAGQDSRLRTKAERYLHAGYARLLSYCDDSGGFSYWGHGEADVALTAYALRFLAGAGQVMTIDDDIIAHARTWLIKQQRADGSWQAYRYATQLDDRRRDASLTAYVSRVLAATEPRPASPPKSTTSPKPTESSLALKRALAYLSVRVEEIDEPYLISSYALAAFDADDRPCAEQAIRKLRTLAHQENGGAYWSLETNTPFYGWGLAGRIETTALAVQALKRMETGGTPALPADAQLINRGLSFLLREKDRYGVWYSTQATINVLDTLLALLASDVGATRTSNTPASAAILVNGRPVKTIQLPAPTQLVSPITIDLTTFVRAGTNQVEIRRANGASPASVQSVATYYLPWSESEAKQNANSRLNGATTLRLVTKFDRTETKVSDEITCHVEAERVGFGGYGMMLAEIGLPPGADVDRASLDRAMKESDWSISQYDILPDRVVVYLWPRAGGAKFDFKFRPRFGINAQTAASTIYDYYNPEARAMVAPVRFVVK
jgi:hypothetical protein